MSQHLSKELDEKIRTLLVSAKEPLEMIFKMGRDKILREEEDRVIYTAALKSLQTIEEIKEILGYRKPNTQLEQIEINF